jgi:hypothetical protein
MTSIQFAVDILRKQEMHPGDHGLCGGAIYFGPDPSQLDRKAHAQGVTLCAEVDLGNVMLAKASHCTPNEKWAQILDHYGYDSVRCTGLASGDEYVVYEPRRVRSIALYSAAQYLFSGRLQGSADGKAQQGRALFHYRVRIVRIHEHPNWPFPILLGDSSSDRLGWCDPVSLRLA